MPSFIHLGRKDGQADGRSHIKRQIINRPREAAMVLKSHHGSGQIVATMCLYVATMCLAKEAAMEWPKVPHE